VYRDKGLITSHGSLKSGGGEFTKPVGFGVTIAILPTNSIRARGHEFNTHSACSEGEIVARDCK
jgi:hypothetical protein